MPGQQLWWTDEMTVTDAASRTKLGLQKCCEQCAVLILRWIFNQSISILLVLQGKKQSINIIRFISAVQKGDLCEQQKNSRTVFYDLHYAQIFFHIPMGNLNGNILYAQSKVRTIALQLCESIQLLMGNNQSPVSATSYLKHQSLNCVEQQPILTV